jgi:hypothetical protein
MINIKIDQIKEVILPILSILSLALGIVLSYKSCSQDDEKIWSTRPQIQEQYYEVSTSTTWELGHGGVAKDTQHLRDQLLKDVDERHPVFRCRILFNEITYRLTYSTKQIVEFMKPYVEEFYASDIDFLVENDRFNQSDFDKYFNENGEINIQVGSVNFLFLELDNIGDRIATDVEFHYTNYNILPSDIFPLSRGNKEITECYSAGESIAVGEIRPSERLLIPIRIISGFSHIHEVNRVPVGPVMVPERIEFTDKATGARKSIHVRGPLKEPKFITTWIFAKG